MQNLTDRIVVLDVREQATKDTFDLLLDKGYPIPLAAKLALQRAVAHWHLTPEELVEWQPFAAWLSDGTLEQRGRAFRFTPEYVDATLTGQATGAPQAGEPRSIGGELPYSRRCWRSDHAACGGSWTRYPDESGPCECPCHRKAGQ